ncbi:hypothetical protein PENTCL1PPCAC_29285, partial [Pristionchus entomophagus]
SFKTIRQRGICHHSSCDMFGSPLARVIYSLLLVSSCLCLGWMYGRQGSPSNTTASSTTPTSTSTSTTSSTSTSTTTTTTEAPPSTTTCPVGGVWSEWVTTGACASKCGACNVATRRRTCTTLCGDCPCTGPSEDVGPCGLALCPFPSPTGTCCKPYKKSINYQTLKFFCGTDNSPVLQCAGGLKASTLETTTRFLLHTYPVFNVFSTPTHSIGNPIEVSRELEDDEEE